MTHKNRNRKKGTFWMTGGLLLLAAALFLTVFNIWDSKRADIAAQNAVEKLTEKIEEKAEENKKMQTEQEISQPDFISYPEKEMPTIEIDGYRYIGYLEIPSIDLRLPVMEEWDYGRLRISPCRYSGSLYMKDLVIAGHNYIRHFTPVKNLPIGSEIRFIDAEGNVFEYVIGWIEILKPQEVEKLTQRDDWDLTLFTCTYGGGSRYTIRCVES